MFLPASYDENEPGGPNESCHHRLSDSLALPIIVGDLLIEERAVVSRLEPEKVSDGVAGGACYAGGTGTTRVLILITT